MTRRRGSSKRSSNRLPRGSRGYDGSKSSITSKGGLASSSSGCVRRKEKYYDLNVQLPRSRKELHGILERLANTGYSVVALTHNVYGKAHVEKDDANVAIPFPLTASPAGVAVAVAHNNKRKRSEATTSNDDDDGTFGLTILKRLNVVLEDLSDLSWYTTTTTSDDAQNDDEKTVAALLRSYDVVSVTPRTERGFSSVCGTSSAPFDVVVLDYHGAGGGRGLPYVVRAADLQAAADRGVALELHYAPSTADPAQRRHWVQTAHGLRAAAAHVVPPKKLRVILSSGPRGTTRDLREMALRSPGDLGNVCRVVLGMAPRRAEEAMRADAAHVVERGRLKRTGRRYGWEGLRPTGGVGVLEARRVEVRAVVAVAVEGEQHPLPLVGDEFSLSGSTRLQRHVVGAEKNDKRHKEGENEKGGQEDGFIHL